MSGTVIVGGQYGDEGKGKVVDYYAEKADVVVRYAGGPNAGHTLSISGKKTILRVIPSGILHPHTVCLMGQGMVLDPLVFRAEVEALEKAGLTVKGRLFISGSAHVIMPYHIMADKGRESTSRKLGTTKKGIGPCYEDKVARRGVRISDIPNSKELVKANYHRWLFAENIETTDGECWDMLSENLAHLDQAWNIFQPYILDVPPYLNEAFKQGKKILFEGAQGSFLDVDHGTYPYVTSSSSTAGGACTGSGVGPTKITKVIGVSKAYATRVGDGPFTTELLGDKEELATLLRTKGGEFGSVTGRPRRVGWLDLVELKQACIVNGVTDLVITKIDVMSGLGLDKFYVRTQDGLVEVDGWKDDITAAKSVEDLPESIQKYLAMIAKETEVPVSLVSVGPDRDANIIIREVI